MESCATCLRPTGKLEGRTLDLKMCSKTHTSDAPLCHLAVLAVSRTIPDSSVCCWKEQISLWLGPSSVYSRAEHERECSPDSDPGLLTAEPVFLPQGPSGSHSQTWS